MVNWKILVIIVLTAVLRLFWLDRVPAALDWDEAAIGWNAKSIWTAHLDEYGTRWPWSFKSFGDYKPPLYIYLTAPMVGLFGTNEISVRLVSVIAGIVSVYLLYLIGSALANKKAGLWAALLLAITPWHLMMSRPAFEPNLALMFVLGGIWLWLKGIKRTPYFILSAISFILSLYSYQSPKIFVPIFVLGLILIYRRQIFTRSNYIYLIITGIITLGLLKPLVDDLKKGAGARFTGTSIFYQKNVNLAPTLVKNYLIHFDPRFLFLGRGDIARIKIDGIGMLQLVEMPLLVLGIYYLWQRRRDPSTKMLFWWVITAPLPAMIGFETPHPIRAYQLLPALVIICALGLSQIKHELLKTLAYAALVLNSLFFLYQYFFVYPVKSAPEWQYGYKQAVLYAREHENEVNKVIIGSDYGQPYIFTYFYQDRKPMGVLWGEMIKYSFRNFTWDDVKNEKQVLVIGSPREVPADADNIVNVINFPDGSVAFRIAKL